MTTHQKSPLLRWGEGVGGGGKSAITFWSLLDVIVVVS